MLPTVQTIDVPWLLWCCIRNYSVKNQLCSYVVKTTCLSECIVFYFLPAAIARKMCMN